MTTYKDIYGMAHFEGIFDIPLAKYNSGIFVDIGVWLGRNTIYMAEQIRDLHKNIKLYAVDTFQGSFSDVTRQMAVDQFGGDFYTNFIQNIKDCKVDDIIIPLRMTSLEAVELFEDNSVDFCFIDGDHAYDSIYADIISWLPKVKSGGIIAGDDYQFWSESVGKVVDLLLPNSGKSWWWMWDKP